MLADGYAGGGEGDLKNRTAPTVCDRCDGEVEKQNRERLNCYKYSIKMYSLCGLSPGS